MPELGEQNPKGYRGLTIVFAHTAHLSLLFLLFFWKAHFTPFDLMGQLEHFISFPQ